MHFYLDGFGERWALPLSKVLEIEILSTDHIYTKMTKFFKYCNVQNMNLKVVKNLGF